jgi:hypothetical protein
MRVVNNIIVRRVSTRGATTAVEARRRFDQGAVRLTIINATNQNRTQKA